MSRGRHNPGQRPVIRGGRWTSDNAKCDDVIIVMIESLVVVVKMGRVVVFCKAVLWCSLLSPVRGWRPDLKAPG